MIDNLSIKYLERPTYDENILLPLEKEVWLEISIFVGRLPSILLILQSLTHQINIQPTGQF